MNEDMKLKSEYKETFAGIHAPEALSRKVRTMSRENKKVGLSVMKKLAVAAALAGIVFVGGNGVAYAATGNSLVENVKILFNGSSWVAQIGDDGREDVITYTVLEEENEEPDGIVVDLTEEESWTTEEYNVTE